MKNVYVSDIASELGLPLFGGGEDTIVSRPADLDGCSSGDLVWLRGHDPDRIVIINQSRPALVICDAEAAPHIRVPHIVATNPRLSFIRCTTRWFAPVEEGGIHPTALVHPRATLGERVTVGAYTRVGPDVTIGDDCVIGSGVALEGELALGRRCRVKANAVIGAPGFGFERAEDGTPLHFPHLGRVVLEDDVWIGACSTIERATLGTTRLCRNVKVDDLVQIGHNTLTGENTLVMANVVICGGVKIGCDCWIAPNSVIKQKINVGDHVMVGLGSVVIRDVKEGQTVIGVPARPILPHTEK
ncbi:MAG: DapH/DapD/GlmU-related protein [bacterium]